jgi:hypothetical protein
MKNQLGESYIGRFQGTWRKKDGPFQSHQALNRAYFLSSIPIGPDRVPSAFLSRGFRWERSLLLAYVNQQTPHTTCFNPQRWSHYAPRINLQNYTVSQHKNSTVWTDTPVKSYALNTCNKPWIWEIQIAYSKRQFLSQSSNMTGQDRTGQYLKLRYNRFLPNSLQFII